MKWPQILVFVYGVFVMIMGAIGGLGLMGSKPSPISIIAGSVAGLIILYFGYLVNKNPRVGYIGATIMAMVNGLQFVPRLSSENPLTARIIVSVSFAVVLALSAAHFMGKGKANSADMSSK